MQAFESSHDSNDVTPLDKAASCYLRLKDYNSALALAKKMSKLNAGDVRVYLRMGQTLQLLQKSALATKIYAKGLQRCRVTAEGYDVCSCPVICQRLLTVLRLCESNITCLKAKSAQPRAKILSMSSHTRCSIKSWDIWTSNAECENLHKLSSCPTDTSC